MSVIYESLPPRITGSPHGFITIRSPKLLFMDNSIAVGYHIKFEWWGQNDYPIEMAIPWKAGSIVDEALFPIRVQRSSIESYFIDMEKLIIEVLDPDGNLYGKSVLDLKRLVDNNLSFDDILIVKALGGKKSVGHLQLQIHANFDKKNELVENKNKLINGFQKIEAIVGADHSDKFPEWPHKLSKSNNNVGFNSSRNLNNKLNKLSRDNVNEKDDSDYSEFTMKDYPGAGDIPMKYEEKDNVHYINTFHANNSKDDDFSLFNITNRSNIEISSSNMKNKSNSDTKMEASTSQRLNDSSYPQIDFQKIRTENLTVPDNSVNMIDIALSRAESLLNKVKTVIPAAVPPLTSEKDNRLESEQKKNQTNPYVDEMKTKTLNSYKNANTVEGIKNVMHTYDSSLRNAYGPVLDKAFVDIGKAKSNGIENINVHDYLDSNTRHISDYLSQRTQVDWLLRGIPEAYDDDMIVDDEVVDRLINEGGLPPSQIAFPSLYSTNQHILNKLHNVKYLRFTINKINVFGTKFGVRKDNTYMVLHCPVGCSIKNSLSSFENKMSISLSSYLLNSSNDIESNSNSNRFLTNNKNRSNRILKSYFVGSLPLSLEFVFDVQLTDSVIQEWLRPVSNVSNKSGATSSIRIELYSNLLPPVTPAELKKKKSVASKEDIESTTLLLGSCMIPLDALLGLNNLNALITSDILINYTSHTAVVNRLNKLLMGVSGSTHITPNGTHENILGNLVSRVELLTVDEYKNQKAKQRSDQTTTSLLQSNDPHSENKNIQNSPATLWAAQQNTSLDNAMNFVPIDPRNESISNTNTALSTNSNSSPYVHLPNHAYIATTTNDGLHNDKDPYILSLSFHEILLSKELFFQDIVKDNYDMMSRQNNAMNIYVVYKCTLNSASIRGEAHAMAIIPSNISSSKKSLADIVINIQSNKMHNIESIYNWKNIYFEVWCDMMSSALMPSSEGRMLIGLCKFAKNTELNKTSKIGIQNPKTGNRIGELFVTIKIQQLNDNSTIQDITKSIENTLLSYKLQRQLLDQDSSGSSKNTQEDNSTNQSVTTQRNVGSINELGAVDNKRERGAENYDSSSTHIFNETNKNSNMCNDSDTQSVGGRDDENGDDVCRDSLDMNSHAISLYPKSSDNEPFIPISKPSNSNLTSLSDKQRHSRNNVMSVDSLQASASYKSEKFKYPFTDIEYASDMCRDSMESVHMAKFRDSLDTDRNARDISSTDNETMQTNVNVSQFPRIKTATDAKHNSKSDSTDSEDLGITSRQSSVTSHILDITIEGIFNEVKQVICSDSDINMSNKSNLIVDSIRSAMGCYVSYTLPFIERNSLREDIMKSSKKADCVNMLWWDSECSLLNRNNRHEFDRTENCIINDIIFSLFPCDENGNLPSNAINIGTAALKPSDLLPILCKSGYCKVLCLPISFDSVLDEIKIESTVMLRLSLSHRIVPVLTRSVEIHSELLRMSRDTARNVNDEESQDHQESTSECELLENNMRITLSNRISADPPAKDSSTNLKVKIHQISNLQCINMGNNGGASIYVVCYSHPTMASIAQTFKMEYQNEEFFTPSLFYQGNTLILDKTEENINTKQTYDVSLKNFDGYNNNKSLRNSELIFSIYTKPSWMFPQALSYHELPNNTQDNLINENNKNIRFGDILVGSAIVDLSLLCLEYPDISGWYHVYDNYNHSKGQIKLTVSLPEDDIIPPISSEVVINKVSGTDNSIEDDNNVKILDEDVSMSSILQKIVQELNQSTNHLLTTSFDVDLNNSHSDLIHLKTKQFTTLIADNDNLDVLDTSCGEKGNVINYDQDTFIHEEPKGDDVLRDDFDLVDTPSLPNIVDSLLRKDIDISGDYNSDDIDNHSLDVLSMSSAHSSEKSLEEDDCYDEEDVDQYLSNSSSVVESSDVILSVESQSSIDSPIKSARDHLSSSSSEDMKKIFNINSILNSSNDMSTLSDEYVSDDDAAPVDNRSISLDKLASPSLTSSINSKDESSIPNENNMSDSLPNENNMSDSLASYETLHSNDSDAVIAKDESVNDILNHSQQSDFYRYIDVDDVNEDETKDLTAFGAHLSVSTELNVSTDTKQSKSSASSSSSAVELHEVKYEIDINTSATSDFMADSKDSLNCHATTTHMKIRDDFKDEGYSPVKLDKSSKMSSHEMEAKSQDHLAKSPPHSLAGLGADIIDRNNSSLSSVDDVVRDRLSSESSSVCEISSERDKHDSIHNSINRSYQLENPAIDQEEYVRPNIVTGDNNSTLTEINENSKLSIKNPPQPIQLVSENERPQIDTQPSKYAVKSVVEQEPISRVVESIMQNFNHIYSQPQQYQLPHRQRPGMRRQFVDRETERISKVMLGKSII